MNIVGSLSLSLIPGMYVDIEIPVINEEHHEPNGYIPKQGTYRHKGKVVDLVRGFFVDNEEVGELDASAFKEPSYNLYPKIRYIHNKPFPNRVYFIGIQGEACVIDIVAVPVHDHSSVHTGGPAYGTYFTNYTSTSED